MASCDSFPSLRREAREPQLPALLELEARIVDFVVAHHFITCLACMVVWSKLWALVELQIRPMALPIQHERLSLMSVSLMISI